MAITELRGWTERKGAQLRAFIAPASARFPAFRHVDSQGSHPEIDRTKFIYSSKGVDELNEQMVERLLALDRASGWREVRRDEGSGIRVFRQRPAPLTWSGGAGPFDTASRFDAVKGTGEIRASPRELQALFMDNARLPDFNQYCSEVQDLAHFAPRRGTAKVSWSATPRLGPLRSRDFVTRVHARRLRDGTHIVCNVAEQLECREQRGRGKARSYVRMEVLLGGQIMRPVAGHARRTAYTTIIHSNPGGAMDSPLGALIVNSIAAKGPVELIQRLRACAADMS